MTRTRMVAVAVLGVAGVAAASLLPVWIGPNFREVVAGRVYRSGQLSPQELEERVKDHGLRSVINLRGEKEDREWYRREIEAVERLGLDYRSLDLVPERLPSRPAVVALLDYLETLEEPILVHCSAGADRAGFAAVLARIAKGGATLSEARSELSLRYGHIPIGPSAEIGRIYDLYEDYLSQSGVVDGPKSFERWAREHYVPYVYNARLEAVSLPSEAQPGERMDVRLRVVNTSPGPWRLTEDVDRGIKLGVRLRRISPDEEEDFLDYDRHGNMDATVEAGGALELDVAVWAPRGAGRYELKLDMVDEHVTWFEEQGSTPLRRTLTVGSHSASFDK